MVATPLSKVLVLCLLLAAKLNALMLRGEGIGAGNATRTRDPNLGKVVLYQLSYSRYDFKARYSTVQRFCVKSILRRDCS